MPKLHIIAQSQDANQFQRALSRYAKEHDTILFISDSVTSLLDKTIIAQIATGSYTCYALTADCLCRGVEKQLPDFILPASDQKMVQLSAECHQIISW